MEAVNTQEDALCMILFFKGAPEGHTHHGRVVSGLFQTHLRCSCCMLLDMVLINDRNAPV
jgi:hypothetical protein